MPVGDAGRLAPPGHALLDHLAGPRPPVSLSKQPRTRVERRVRREHVPFEQPEEVWVHRLDALPPPFRGRADGARRFEPIRESRGRKRQVSDAESADRRHAECRLVEEPPERPLRHIQVKCHQLVALVIRKWAREILWPLDGRDRLRHVAPQPLPPAPLRKLADGGSATVQCGGAQVLLGERDKIATHQLPGEGSTLSDACTDASATSKRKPDAYASKVARDSPRARTVSRNRSLAVLSRMVFAPRRDFGCRGTVA